MLINLLLNKFGDITREELQKMTEPLMSNIKNSRFYQEVKQEVREEGREETARNMLAEGLDISLIAKATGLSEQTIIELAGI